MGTIWNLIKAVVLTRKVPKDKLTSLIDEMDADRDGYISVKEVLGYISGLVSIYGGHERSLPLRRWHVP